MMAEKYPNRTDDDEVAQLKSKIADLECQLSTQDIDVGEFADAVIIDLGKKKKKWIKKLKKGRGKLMRRVYETVHEVQQSLGDEADGKQLLPVVVIYRKKSKSSKWKLPLL